MNIKSGQSIDVTLDLDTKCDRNELITLLRRTVSNLF